MITNFHNYHDNLVDNQNANHHHLTSKLYKLGGELGKGGFGVVYAAVRRADKLQVDFKYGFVSCVR